MDGRRRFMRVSGGALVVCGIAFILRLVVEIRDGRGAEPYLSSTGLWVTPISALVSLAVLGGVALGAFALTRGGRDRHRRR